MRNVLASLLLLAATAPAATAQTAWADKLFGGNTSKDFGVVPRGTQLKCSFPVTNIYAVPLEITSVRSSCGCLTATPTKQVLQPQESAALDIHMDAGRFSGPKAINVYITVGPEFISTATLRISANARQDVVLNPGQISFGVVAAGRQITQSVDIEYTGSQDWRINEVVKNAEAPYDIKVDQVMRQPARLLSSGKVVYRLAVTLKPNAPAGPHKHEIHLKTSDASQVISVPVEARVQASLAVSPNPANFRNVQVGKTATLNIQVRGQKPFTILKIEGAGDGIRAEHPNTSAPSHVVTVHFQPERDGTIQRTLQIRTDLDGGTTVNVTVEANGVN